MESSPTARGASIQVQSVRKVFRGRALDEPTVAVESVSMTIQPGEFVSLLGPSGCGKSTVLRLIAGLETPTSGRVVFDPPPAQEIAFVFQDAHLLPWRTVGRNVALPLELQRIPEALREERVAKVVEMVGLSDAIHRYPAQLSGGMRMRVSLARAMVTNPRVLLLDEPFAALDELTRQHLDEQLRHLWRRTGMTVLFVTHSINEAAFLSDRAVVFSRRPARILLDHVIDLPPDRPANLRVSPEFSAQARILFDALEQGAL